MGFSYRDLPLAKSPYGAMKYLRKEKKQVNKVKKMLLFPFEESVAITLSSTSSYNKI